MLVISYQKRMFKSCLGLYFSNRIWKLEGILINALGDKFRTLSSVQGAECLTFTKLLIASHISQSKARSRWTITSMHHNFSSSR